MNRWIISLWAVLVLLLIPGAAQAVQPDELLPTNTPTITATATAAPSTSTSPTPSATPAPDAWEPNDTADLATPIDIGQRLDKLSFWPLGDVDYFSLVVKDGQRGMTLLIDTEHGFGLDTRLRLLTSDGQLVAENDDASPTEARSHIAVVIHTAGRYVVEVTNRAESRPDWKTYSLVAAWQHQQPTATPTITPTRTPTPGPSATPGPTSTPGPTATPTPPPWDAAEPNNDWTQAREIAIGEPVAGLNFVCPDASGCVDNDFFQVVLKAGICYHIATTDLQPGIDTNLIVYGPGKDTAPPLTGNDDATPGSFGSQVTLCLPPGSDTLTSYLLIGQSGNRRPPEPVHTRTYTLTVAVVPPATPTPTIAPTAIPSAAPTVAPPTELGPGANPAPHASSPPRSEPTARPTSTPEPTPTSGTTPAPLAGVTITELTPASAPQAEQQPQIAVSLGLRACYDRNANERCDVDEGIGGLTVYVADDGRGTLLGQVLTDSSGTAQLTIRADEDAQLSVSVPYFAAVQTVAARSPRLEPIIVTDHAPLPALLP